MKLTLLVLVFLLPLLVSATAPSPQDYNKVFTRHSEVGNFMEVNLGNQLNVYTNDYGEPELFFDSRNLQGFVQVFSGVGGEPLLGEVKFSDLQLAKDNRGETYSELKNGLDGKPPVTASVERNKIILNYNPLSEECGGNYVLRFVASNPSVKVDEKIPVKLRVHIPCEADLLMVLSPKMGGPSGEFLTTLRSYMKVAGDEGKTVKVTTLPQSVFTANDATSVPIDKEVTLTYVGGYVELFDNLKIFLDSVIRDAHGELVYKDEFRITDGTYATVAIRDPSDLDVYYSNEWINDPFPDEELNFSAVEKQKEFIDLEWFNLSFVVNSGLANSDEYPRFFFPELCDKGWPPRGIKTIEDSERVLKITGVDASCERLVGISSVLFASPRLAGITKETEIVENGVSVRIKLVSHGKLRVVKRVTARITGVTTSPEFLERKNSGVVENNIKNRISRLRKVHKPKYLLLVGSVNHIPMPFEKDVEAPKEDYRYLASSDGIIPSDSLYVLNRDKNLVEIPVARIPIALDEINSWKFASLVLNNAVNSRTNSRGKKISLLSDACGKKGDCFIKRDTNWLIDKLQDADANFTLRLSPPVCRDAINCNELTKIISDFNNADYAQVNAHGNGAGFYSESATGVVFDTLFARDISRNVNNPGLRVSLYTCYSGSIDKDLYQKPIGRANSIAFAFLQAGAPLLLGNTRFGRGGAEVNARHNNAMLLTLIDKDKRPAGNVVNDYMNTQLNQQPIFRSSALSRQIYGDPLLPFYKPA